MAYAALLKKSRADQHAYSVYPAGRPRYGRLNGSVSPRSTLASWPFADAAEPQQKSFDAKWGGLPDGHVVGKPVPLFPRIE
jgi:hypothetical protein